jgi:hypothetical protein
MQRIGRVMLAMTMRFAKMLYTVGVYKQILREDVAMHINPSECCVLREGFSFGYYLVEIKRRLPEKRTNIYGRYFQFYTMLR